MDGDVVGFDEDFVSFGFHLRGDAVYVVRGECDMPEGALGPDPGAVAENLQQAETGIDHDPFRPFTDDGKPEDPQVKILCPGKLFSGAAFQGNMVNAGDHGAFSSSGDIIHDPARECKGKSKGPVSFDGPGFIW